MATRHPLPTQWQGEGTGGHANVLDSRLIPLVLALLLDLVLGDLPNRYHPVAWMGAGIGVARHLAPQGRWQRCLYGAVVVIAGAVLVGGIGVAAERVLHLLPQPLYWLAEAFIFKTTLALRGLVRAA